MHTKMNLILLVLINVFLLGNGQPQALYNGGDFAMAPFAPIAIPTTPLTLDQVNIILALSPTENVDANTRPCISIMKGQNVGYRLVQTQASGITFMPSNGLCPCNSCFRVAPCCGSTVSSNGIIIPCYAPIACQGNKTCLRNYECFGMYETSSTVSLMRDLQLYVDTVPLNQPCFKISFAAPGSNGFVIKTLVNGTGFQIMSCNTTVETACLSLRTCCTGKGIQCYTATPCCVPSNGVASKDCLSITRCDIPN
jgi:hypothetical protein